MANGGTAVPWKGESWGKCFAVNVLALLADHPCQLGHGFRHYALPVVPGVAAGGVVDGQRKALAF